MASRRPSSQHRRIATYGISPPPAPIGVDPREAASLELARRLQRDANALAMREYEDHLIALEFAREHNVDAPPPPPPGVPAQGTFLQELHAMQAHHDHLVAFEYGQEHHLDAAQRETLRRRVVEPQAPPVGPSSPTHGALMRELLAMQAHHDHLVALEWDQQHTADGVFPAGANARLAANERALYDSEDEELAFPYRPPVDHGIHADGLATVAAMPLVGMVMDPDHMTYEERLALSERVGDVMRERWRQVSMEVLASLPTQRWTQARSREDGSCIICQSAYAVGDMWVTLPCAHVFHDDCLSGWGRDNNCCPLCKREIKNLSS